MPASDHRLTTPEMAEFVATGILRFDAIIPADINERVVAELESLFRAKIAPMLGQPEPPLPFERPESLTPLSECYASESVLGEYLRLPQVQGIIRSLVGSAPIYDHDFVHHLPAGSTYEQHLHVDAVVDSEDPTFDIQLFYFPNEVKPGEGGTRYVPGSHLRRVRAEGVSRYQHLVGEAQYAGPAGTLMVFHHGVWHAGQRNPGPDRWMHKIRLNPTTSQVRQWNLDDFDEHHNDARDHVFAKTQPGSVAERLRVMLPWQRGHEERYEQMERARLWRYLSGDPTFDVDYYFTRLEGRAKLVAGAEG